MSTRAGGRCAGGQSAGLDDGLCVHGVPPELCPDQGALLSESLSRPDNVYRIAVNIRTTLGPVHVHVGDYVTGCGRRLDRRLPVILTSRRRTCRESGCWGTR